MSKVYQLREADIKALRMSADPSQGGVDWGLRFYFDRTFTKWQHFWHHAPHPDSTIMAGTGSGKTFATALSSAIFSVSMPRFVFLNLAPTHMQAKLAFDILMREAADKPFERFIDKVVEKPFPKIIFKSNYIGESVWMALSAHSDAKAIQGIEADWINIDEAGQILDPYQLMGMVATRLRGNVSLGKLKKTRPRLNKLSMVTASYLEAPPWLWERMDMGTRDPGFLSMTISSREAGTLSEKALSLYEKRVPKEHQSALLGAERPEGQGEHFSLQTVTACENTDMNRWMQHHTYEKPNPTPDWHYQEQLGAGCIKWQMAPERGRDYIMAGDPGQGNPPTRNAGVIIVLDVTEYPKKPATLRYFDWINGNGSYEPFKASYKYAYDLYRPIAALVDSTSTQSLWAEQVLIGLNINAIGMDFSGKKNAMLVTAMNMFQRRQIQIPYIQGFRSQLVTYSIADDTKLSQDIVATLLMLAFYMRHSAWEDFTEHSDLVATQSLPVDSVRDVRSNMRNFRNPRGVVRTRSGIYIPRSN